jgi:hypothetical protein
MKQLFLAFLLLTFFQDASAQPPGPLPELNY